MTLYTGRQTMTVVSWLKERFLTRCWQILILFFLGWPDSAWAVQQHGGAEGLVSHQLAHLLFICGMLYLLHRLTFSLPRGRGWKEFKLFIWLIICWNVLTFYGHWHRELIDPGKFILSQGHTVGMTLVDLTDLLFYFSRLDHLLLLPAFFCLLSALVRWRDNP